MRNLETDGAIWLKTNKKKVQFSGSSNKNHPDGDLNKYRRNTKIEFIIKIRSLKIQLILANKGDKRRLQNPLSWDCGHLQNINYTSVNLKKTNKKYERTQIILHN